jgi:hypothetical protein
MTTAKVIRVSGSTATEIDETALLLQDFIDKATPEEVRKLLLAVKKKPSIF